MLLFSALVSFFVMGTAMVDLPYIVRNVKRNNISYNMSLPVWRAIFLPCSKKPYSAGFAAMQ